MKRVLIETQSGKLFRGSRVEQNYDQRGGLCQVGAEGVIVTTNPIDSNYLQYWQTIGFSLPEMVVAGPYEKESTLSELIMNKSDVTDEILSRVTEQDARLEFFWIEESERELAKHLGIPAYCTFDVAINYACKKRFKDIATEIGLQTPKWIPIYGVDSLKLLAPVFAKMYGDTFLVKASKGTGGIDMDGMYKATVVGSDVETLLEQTEDMQYPLILEQIIPNVAHEVSVQWEITEDGEFAFGGFFDQISKDFAYAGAEYPSNMPSYIQGQLWDILYEKLLPYLSEHKAKGFFCCDVLVDEYGNDYWIDFNPRKGAIVYIRDMVNRLRDIHGYADEYVFVHDHISIEKDGSFSDIKNSLSDLLNPSGDTPYVIITNPGVIPYGTLDITGIASTKEDARAVLVCAEELLAKR